METTLAEFHHCVHEAWNVGISGTLHQEVEVTFQDCSVILLLDVGQFNLVPKRLSFKLLGFGLCMLSFPKLTGSNICGFHLEAHSVEFHIHKGNKSVLYTLLIPISKCKSFRKFLYLLHSNIVRCNGNCNNSGV